jgi:ferredoxin/flavodoxin
MTETEKKPSALIIYLSPHGTTRRAVEALSASLTQNGVATDVYNLVESGDRSDMEKLHGRMSSCSLIVFGSPTYFHHAPPVFMDFIRKIPDAAGNQAAAILSTFGGVSSGVIQFDLAAILHEKKYSLIGGIQVLAEHCLTFQENNLFHGGCPGEADLAVIREFGKEMAIRLMNKNRRTYNPNEFKDKPFLLNFFDAHVNSLKTFAWCMPGVRIKKTECTGCGLCVLNCPTGNIAIEQTAVHGKNCTYCYSCVRYCPAGATTAFLKPAASIVRWLAGRFARYEEQTTRQVV